ncbi:bifunctional terpene synthase/polyprenyl synthetase family protein [Aspergillus stella-maris]|uniref:bifunctional terpene synthase/polyprenyl synthetase family protein n=1 Tax=Aspergillus stella-maris TaxID=1810926 RepID=UPI003CCD4B26
MACALDGLSFKDFKLPSLDIERPKAYFNTIPYRVWEHNIDCSDTIDKALSDWQLITGKDASKALGNRSQDLYLCLAPECPPHILPLFVRFGYITFFWDDATDSLDADAHERIQLDLRAAILSEVKLGRHTRCEFQINELYIESLKSLLSQVEGIDSHFRLNYDVFDSGLAAQTVAPLHTLTWEGYKAHRTKTVGGKVLSRLMPVVNGIRCTDEELDSVANMIRLGDLITGLTNDFHSFHKEFDEHFQAETLDSIHNGMAVLMSNYGYDENEAGGILKQEVLALETQLMSEYETWSFSTAPKSDDLRRYMFISVLTIGGMNRWQSITPRYHRNDFTTTDSDRAQLVGQSYDVKLRLPQYPSPSMAVTVGRRDPIGTDSLLENSVEPAAEVAPKNKEILAPFEKAPAEKIVLAPWEYIRALPGKMTLGRMIECLESWFQLPKESTDIIRETTRILFDATLMLDDIQDGSQLRRGRPAAHAIFGQPQTINSATYLFVKGSRQLKDLKMNQECGEDYLIMVDNKTGAFFRLVLRLLETETESEPTPELLHLFTLVGRYYQIRDDYMNLASDEYTAKKGFCEDLSEGKFSFPLIHLLQNTPSPNNIRGILFNRDINTDLSIEAKQFVLDQMKETGSLTYTKETLDNLFDAMIETFDNVQATLGSNNKLRIFLLWLKI